MAFRKKTKPMSKYCEHTSKHQDQGGQLPHKFLRNAITNISTVTGKNRWNEEQMEMKRISLLQTIFKGV